MKSLLGIDLKRDPRILVLVFSVSGHFLDALGGRATLPYALTRSHWDGIYLSYGRPSNIRLQPDSIAVNTHPFP